MRSITNIIKLSLLLTTLKCSVSASIIASFDGTTPISASTYASGLGNEGDANYVIPMASLMSTYGDSFTIRVVMGDFVDYFKPVDGSTYADMISTNNKHLWSSTADGTFVAPDYYLTNSNLLGGSNIGWPSDGRQYLTFWAGTSLPGGGVQSIDGGPVSWGQAFTIEAVVPVTVPEPSSSLMAGIGIIILASSRRRSK